MTRQDSGRLVDELLTLGVASGHVPRMALKRDLDHLIARYSDRPIKEWAASQMFNEVMSIALRHHLHLPSDLALLTRLIAMSEGLGAQLAPDFRLLEFAEPFLRRIWLESREPARLARKVAQGLLDLTDLSLDMPQHLRR
ncbi:MAG: AarF/ABC1/UbiB kinase family protein, partial [Chloroflexi bacterium]|nr:AarF/ABC1/UbiB kinase family protein [Chloroflexota bacterium]